MIFKTNLHNINMKQEFFDEACREISEDIADFIIELRDALETETPKDTTYASLNWLIRKQPTSAIYGKKSPYPSKREKRYYNQPRLSIQAQGITTAIDFDISKGNGKLVVFNNVDYIEDLTERTYNSLHYEEILGRISSKYGF